MSFANWGQTCFQAIQYWNQHVFWVVTTRCRCQQFFVGVIVNFLSTWQHREQLWLAMAPTDRTIPLMLFNLHSCDRAFDSASLNHIISPKCFLGLCTSWNFSENILSAITTSLSGLIIMELGERFQQNRFGLCLNNISLVGYSFMRILLNCVIIYNKNWIHENILNANIYTTIVLEINHYCYH